MSDERKEMMSILGKAISRRQFGRGVASAGMFAAVAAQVGRPQPARAANVVNVLAWEGYDDPALTSAFEEETGIKVNVKTASSNSNQLDQIRAGALQFDVVNPDTVWTEKFAKSGLTMPLDRADFPHLEEMFEPFKHCEDCVLDGKLYGVTTRWGINGIVHWRDKLSEADAADAMSIWDDKFANRITIIDWAELYLWQAGEWLGMSHPETATGDDLQKIVDRLIAIKPNLRAIQSEVGAVKTDLANQDAWIVWGASSNQTSIAVQEAGLDMALTIPKQGGAMWTEFAADRRQLAQRRGGQGLPELHDQRRGARQVRLGPPEDRGLQRQGRRLHHGGAVQDPEHGQDRRLGNAFQAQPRPGRRSCLDDGLAAVQGRVRRQRSPHKVVTFGAEAQAWISGSSSPSSIRRSWRRRRARNTRPAPLPA